MRRHHHAARAKHAWAAAYLIFISRACYPEEEELLCHAIKHHHLVVHAESSTRVIYIACAAYVSRPSAQAYHYPNEVQVPLRRQRRRREILPAREAAVLERWEMKGPRSVHACRQSSRQRATRPSATPSHYAVSTCKVMKMKYLLSRHTHTVLSWYTHKRNTNTISWEDNRKIQHTHRKCMRVMHKRWDTGTHTLTARERVVVATVSLSIFTRRHFHHHITTHMCCPWGRSTHMYRSGVVFIDHRARSSYFILYRH